MVIQNLPLLSGAIKSFKVYQDLTAPDIDYDILNLQAGHRELQADHIRNQVEEEANMMKDQFIEAVGTFKAMAARRGVKVGEGNVSENIEMSSKALGKDIQKLRGTAEFKAGQLRGEGERLRIGARYARDIGRTEKIGKAAEGFGSAIESFGKMGEFGEVDETYIPKSLKEMSLLPPGFKEKKFLKKKPKKGLLTDYTKTVLQPPGYSGIYRPTVSGYGGLTSSVDIEATSILRKGRI